jgi:hypothetical protein
MHPVPLDILISEQQKKQRREEQQPQPMQLPLPEPPPHYYENEKVVGENEEKRGVVIIDTHGDVTEGFIV